MCLQRAQVPLYHLDVGTAVQQPISSTQGRAGTVDAQVKLAVGHACVGVQLPAASMCLSMPNSCGVENGTGRMFMRFIYMQYLFSLIHVTAWCWIYHVRDRTTGLRQGVTNERQVEQLEAVHTSVLANSESS